MQNNPKLHCELRKIIDIFNSSSCRSGIIVHTKLWLYIAFKKHRILYEKQSNKSESRTIFKRFSAYVSFIFSDIYPFNPHTKYLFISFNFLIHFSISCDHACLQKKDRGAFYTFLSSKETTMLQSIRDVSSISLQQTSVFVKFLHPLLRWMILFIFIHSK